MYKKSINLIWKNRLNTVKILILSMLLLFAFDCKNNSTEPDTPTSSIIQFVYTSDSHFGLKKITFQGASNVDANVVNAVMVAKMNNLSTLTLPNDNGINAGKVVGCVDYIINTGDFSNRQEIGIQSATTSWEQFTTTFMNGVTLKNRANQKAEIFLSPGNHDVSNAIGYYKAMNPFTDNGAILGNYNYVFPSNPKTISTYNYTTDKIHYSKDISGMHFVFVNMWPDSSERIWIENDLKYVSSSTPVFLFVHDQPDIESKHLTNPNGAHDINATNKFENLLPEVFKDGTKITDPSNIEQRSFVAFLKAHTNIKAYFHGNTNENRYYDYKGPDNDVTLKVFQVDSPMKGNYSETDETKLSFQLVSVDTKAKIMTVRECLWNTTPSNPSAPIIFGESITVSIQ